jgi:uncharacterized integral membrane protein
MTLLEAPPAPSLPQPPAAPRQRATDVVRSLAEGELVALRVVAMLAVIWLIFQVQNDRFLSAMNLTNLTLQIAAIGLISTGVVPGGRRSPGSGRRSPSARSSAPSTA